MLIVTNTQPNIVTIPGPYTKSPDGTGAMSEFHIHLKPGTNIVSPKEWDRVKDYPTVQVRLKPERDRRTKKLLQPHLIAETNDAKSFETMKVPDALALVETTLDRNQLREWLDEEHRSEVRKAISDQIRAVTSERVQEIGTAAPDIAPQG